MALGFSFALTTSLVMSWLKVLVTIPIIFVMIFVALYAWRLNRFCYPVMIVRDIGAGKVIIDYTKAGKFKQHKKFFNLFDVGGEFELITKKGQIITNFSDQDMHDIAGKKGFIVVQKPDDQKILCPIAKTQLQNMELVMQIAPADYRDIAVSLKKKSEKEMLSQLETYMPYISLAIVSIVIFLIFVITFQYVSGMLGELASKCNIVTTPPAVAIPQLPSSAP